MYTEDTIKGLVRNHDLMRLCFMESGRSVKAFHDLRKKFGMPFLLQNMMPTLLPAARNAMHGGFNFGGDPEIVRKTISEIRPFIKRVEDGMDEAGIPHSRRNALLLMAFHFAEEYYRGASIDIALLDELVEHFGWHRVVGMASSGLTFTAMKQGIDDNIDPELLVSLNGFQ